MPGPWDHRASEPIRRLVRLLMLMLTECFYHPNPMTKPAGTPRKKPEPRRRKLHARADTDLLRSDGRLTSLTLSPPTLRNDTSPVPLNISWQASPESATKSAPTGPEQARNFFLGSTSYAAVFTEQHPLPETVHEQPSERLSVTSSTAIPTMGHRRCQFAIGHTIVSALQPFSFIEKSLKMYFDTQKVGFKSHSLYHNNFPSTRH
jgi:hypothetical protein